MRVVFSRTRQSLFQNEGSMADLEEVKAVEEGWKERWSNIGLIHSREFRANKVWWQNSGIVFSRPYTLGAARSHVIKRLNFQMQAAPLLSDELQSGKPFTVVVLQQASLMDKRHLAYEFFDIDEVQFSKQAADFARLDQHFSRWILFRHQWSRSETSISEGGTAFGRSDTLHHTRTNWNITDIHCWKGLQMCAISTAWFTKISRRSLRSLQNRWQSYIRSCTTSF